MRSKLNKQREPKPGFLFPYSAPHFDLKNKQNGVAGYSFSEILILGSFSVFKKLPTEGKKSENRS